MRRRGQGLRGRFDGVRIGAFHGLLQGRDGVFDLGLVARVDLVAVLLEVLFGLIDQVVGLVLRFRRLAALLVFIGMRLRILDQLLDFFLAQAAGCGDLDRLFLLRRQIFGRHVDDAVRVDVEGDFDLRHAAGSGRNADEIELAQQLVVVRHFALPLEDADGDGRLVVRRRGEDLALLRRDGGVPLDQLREDAAQRFDAQRQRGDVEKEHILYVALQHTALDAGADGNDLVRVHAAMGLLTEEFLDDLNDFRHAGHAADQYDLVDIARSDAGVGQSLLAGLDRALNQVVHQLLQLGPGQLGDQVLRSAGVGRDEREVDFRFLRGRELDFCAFGRFLQALEGHAVLAKVYALVLLELVDQPIHDALVEIVAAQIGVAVGRFDFEDSFADFEHGDVEGSAAQVVDGDPFVFLFVEAVGERGRGRLVDDAEDV